MQSQESDSMDGVEPLTDTLSKLSTQSQDTFAVPKLQHKPRQRSKSMNLHLETPNQRLVKPLATAFHSTGVISKKNKPKPHLHNTPITPIKHKQYLDNVQPSSTMKTSLLSAKPPKMPFTPMTKTPQPFSFYSPCNSHNSPFGVTPFKQSTFKSNKLQRSPLAESPLKSNKRLHLSTDDSPQMKSSDLNIAPLDTPVSKFKTGFLELSPGFEAESPSQSLSSKSIFYPQTSPIVKKTDRNIFQEKKKVAEPESPGLPSKIFFANMIKDKKKSTHPIPFSSLISRYRLPIDNQFFEALDGAQPALKNLLAVIQKYTHEDGTSPIPDYFETRFVIEARLGHGSFADAYHVISMENAEHYAIKKTRQPFLGYKDATQKLEEVKMLLAVSGHPNCVNLKDAWIQYGYIYIQMELCVNGSLSKYLEESCAESALAEDHIWTILYDITKGLAHIHSLGIAHLDIKPANIFITANGRLKIGDFGLACKVPVVTGDHEGDRTYLAPEMLSDEEIGCPADIFSLGMIVLEIAANIVLPENGPVWHQFREVWCEFSNVD
ncbi:hypothetical protein HDV04_002100 [Boothiomyces sp. JEL0838]|nr:hypothetical protein HDV04_002100 [Boothiomyces sp. JEL0838]